MSTQGSSVEPRRERTMELKTIVKLVVAAFAALLLLIVIIQNTEHVNTRILFWTFNMPRVVLLFLSMVVGFALGMTATLTWFSPRRRD